MIRMSQPQERLELEYSRQKEIANADALIQEEAQYLHGEKNSTLGISEQEKIVRGKKLGR